MKAFEDPADSPELSGLLEEYIDRRRELDSSALRELESRAGEQGEAFRRHVALVRDLEDLSRLLAEGEDAAEPELPRIGRFETLSCLGVGGLSEVFLAYDPNLDRQIALKVLQPSAIRIANAREWMTTEGQSLARLQHPAVVQVFDLAQLDGVFYVAMEYVAGPSLREVLDALRSLAGRPTEVEPTPGALRAARALQSIGARCELVLRLARALSFCHAKGIVHRDVKPDNVLLDKQGHPKLIDFGLAHLESLEGTYRRTRQLVGTLPYLAPEQIDAGRTGTSAASDLFSLGVVFYELLTLEHPFRAESHAAIAAAISAASPVPPRRANPAVPTDVELVCLHALERRPEDRYRSMDAFATDLEAFLGHRAISIQPPSTLRRGTLWLRRNRHQVRVAAGTLAAVLCVLLLAWAWDARARRASFRQRLAENARRVPSAERATDFESLVKGTPWEEAPVLDASFAAPLLFGSVGPELERLRSELGARFRTVVDPLRAAALGKVWAPERRKACGALFDDWGKAIELYDEHLGGPAGLAPYGDWETVELPADGELLRYKHDRVPGYPLLEPVVGERSHLERGFYRYRVEREGTSCETEFFLRKREPGWKLRLEPLASWLESKMLRIPPGAIPADAPEDLHVPPFLASPLITWSEAERVLGDELQTLVLCGVDPSANPQAPARIPWALAQEFATRVGGRLPAAVEAYWTWLATEPLPPPAPRQEWISLPYDEEEHYNLVLRAPDSLSQRPALSRQMEQYSNENIVTVPCFRVVHTARD